MPERDRGKSRSAGEAQRGGACPGGDRQRAPTYNDITGELVPRAERKRSRFERAGSEAEHVPEGRASESHNRVAHEAERR